MAGLTIRITVATAAAVIDFLGGAARLLFVFTTTQFIHKLVESKMFRKGRARISPKGTFDVYKILVLLVGVLMTALSFFAIFFIDSSRRIHGIRPVTINRLKVCKEGSQEATCKLESVARLNTTGSTFDTTTARFEVEGGLRNAEEIVNGTSVITLKDCAIKQRADLCDSEMLEFLQPEYIITNISLTADLSKVKRTGEFHKLYLGAIEDIEGGTKGSIRSRTLCESDISRSKINHCSRWFVREDRKEILIFFANRFEDTAGCDDEASSCVVGKISLLNLRNSDTLGIATDYEGIAFLLDLDHRTDEFLDNLSEMLAARNMVLNKALWDVLRFNNVSVETISSVALGEEIVEDTELRVPSLALLGVMVITSLISAITLCFLHFGPWKRVLKYPAYDFTGVTMSVLRSVRRGHNAEDLTTETGHSFERSSVPLYITVRAEEKGTRHIESYRGSSFIGSPKTTPKANGPIE